MPSIKRDLNGLMGKTKCEYSGDLNDELVSYSGHGLNIELKVLCSSR